MRCVLARRSAETSRRNLGLPTTESDYTHTHTPIMIYVIIIIIIIISCVANGDTHTDKYTKCNQHN